MDKTERNNLIKKWAKFLLLFIVLDLTLGSLAKDIFFSQKTGKYARLTYSIEQDNSDIIIMGSSHANRHYVPKIIKSELKKTCYNTGVQGQNMLFQLALQKMILRRHKPNTIILNIDKKWMEKSEGAYGLLADLYPYYWNYRSELYPILSLGSKYIDYKLLFNSYQTNSTFVHVVKYFLIPQKDINGYIPLYGKLKKKKNNINQIKNEQDVPANEKESNSGIDENFVNALKVFIVNAKKYDINMLLVKSPALRKDRNLESNKSYRIMHSIAAEYDIPLIDYTNNPKFNNQYYLFNDPAHLNDDGAKIFTKMLSDKIKQKHYLKF